MDWKTLSLTGKTKNKAREEVTFKTHITINFRESNRKNVLYCLKAMSWTPKGSLSYGKHLH